MWKKQSKSNNSISRKQFTRNALKLINRLWNRRTRKKQNRRNICKSIQKWRCTSKSTIYIRNSCSSNNTISIITSKWHNDKYNRSTIWYPTNSNRMWRNIKPKLIKSIWSKLWTNRTNRKWFWYKNNTRKTKTTRCKINRNTKI